MFYFNALSIFAVSTQEWVKFRLRKVSTPILMMGFVMGIILFQNGQTSGNRIGVYKLFWAYFYTNLVQIKPLKILYLINCN